MSLSGSTETKIDSIEKNFDYDEVRTFYKALANFIKEFGQMSGQLQNPK